MVLSGHVMIVSVFFLLIITEGPSVITEHVLESK